MGYGRPKWRLLSLTETKRVAALIDELQEHGVSGNWLSERMGHEASWLRGQLREARRYAIDDFKDGRLAVIHALSILEFIAGGVATTSIGPDYRKLGETSRRSSRAREKKWRDLCDLYPSQNRELAKVARLAAGELVKMRLSYAGSDLAIRTGSFDASEPQHILPERKAQVKPDHATVPKFNTVAEVIRARIPDNGQDA
jgi:hypothetical protein